MGEKTNRKIAEITTSPSAAGAVLASAAALLGADLVVVALAWDHPPTEGGIFTITFLMMISFVAFINVMHQIMRMEYVITKMKLEETEKTTTEKYNRELLQISKWSRILHVVGLLFTMVAFWVISYKYLISLLGYHIAILLLPFVLFLLFWIPKLAGVEKEVKFLSSDYFIQFIIHIVFLFLICLDFFTLISIP